MPGPRLTYQDRRRITAGLAAGLRYADIARELNRPTSTISREIARNGGPERYRAEPAQRTAEQRAQRRPDPTASPARPIEPADPTPEPAAQLSALLVRMGLQRMASRIYAWMCVSDADSFTTADLAHALSVSPASISKAVGYLTGIGLLLRERQGRRDRYSIGRDVWFRVGQASVSVEEQFVIALRRAGDTLGGATPAGARLADLAWSFEAAYHFNLQGVERMRAAAGPHVCPKCGCDVSAP
ncbi:helix-turn-helix domain-containing protein [Nocardia sp. NPDC127526]|uniref:GbsR/MarR family transcriptional regulator n=1 Tax=Nocardia sp. NPDC127526 TaxID=3345393 RepID=UPI00363AC835